MPSVTSAGLLSEANARCVLRCRSDRGEQRVREGDGRVADMRRLHSSQQACATEDSAELVRLPWSGKIGRDEVVHSQMDNLHFC